MTTFGTEL